MSLLSEFKGNVVLSSDTGTSTTVGTTLKVNTVEAKAATDAIALYNNATSGTLTMGSALTSNLLLGSTSNITQVQGTLVANALNPKSASANMTIASISTNSTLTVGSNMTASGGITLGSSASSTTVNGTLKTDTITSTTAAGTTNINTSGNGSTTIGTSGGTGAITMNRPITVGYSPTFSAGQIGYSQTFSQTGNVVSGTNNVYRITNSSTALVGVYHINLGGFVYNSGGNFIGTTFFMLETGNYGGAVLARNYNNASGPNGLTFDNYQQSVSAVYSSSVALDLYGAIQITYSSATGGTTPIYGMTIIATRIA